MRIVYFARNEFRLFIFICDRGKENKTLVVNIKIVTLPGALLKKNS